MSRKYWRLRVSGGALALLLAMGGTTVSAQGAPGAAGETPASPAAGATAGAPFDAEAATEAYLARYTPEQKERSDSYFEGGYWLILWGFLYGAAVAYLLLAARISARLRDFAARRTRSPFLQSWIYALLYILVSSILSFPLAVYTAFFREHKYGLSTQTFGAWLGDQGKELGIALVLGALALTALYAVLRRAPRTWWIWGAVVSVVFLIVGVTIAPVFIEPLFNEYTVLDDAKLRDPILSMAHANGIPAEQVFLVDASKQSNRVSANVAGMFGTMRIALNDNLLKRASPAGVKAVMGHEMGHYVLNHIYEMIPFFGILLASAFAFANWGFHRLLANGRGERWGVAGIADPAGLPALGLVLSVFFFLMTPVLNTFIRTNEAEADLFGLNAAREPDGMAEVALLLGEYRKLSPGPIEEWIFFDHPSGRNRILAAMRWKGEELKKGGAAELAAESAPAAPAEGAAPAPPSPPSPR